MNLKKKNYLLKKLLKWAFKKKKKKKKTKEKKWRYHYFTLM